ncbi:MAG: hypothetical protein LBT21_04020 [Oscillospiraceae bacterium]|jgi:hypothetical protein|nr:hypothetical protein [Oscillospiraceae bacterium]
MHSTAFESALKQFGRAARLFSPGGEQLAEYHAFVQPLRYKNKLYLYGVHTEIGYNSQGHYLYLGPAAYTLQDDGQELEIGGDLYRVERAETVFLADDPLYVWAVIRRKGEVSLTHPQI